MKRFYRFCLFFSCLTASFQLRASDSAITQPSNTIRLAIGSFGLSEQRNGQLNDLLVTKLSKENGLELVERQSLQTALQEAALSLSGLVRAKDAIHVGRLLRADWFLLGTTNSANGTNSILVRLVDARSGVIRDVAAFREDPQLPLLADELATFIQRAKAKSADNQLYLAVGGFQDISINNRFADFSGRLRSYLTKEYQRNPKVTLLEREAVAPLLNELRMDLIGLTAERPTNNASSAQTAFWIVDGYYQSYEVSSAEVDLVLRVERIGGERKSSALRGKPDEQLFQRVTGAIEARLTSTNLLTRPAGGKDEIEAQLSRGKQRSGLDESNLEFALFFGEPVERITTADPIKRRRNIEEAVQAFETVLLLDPDNREAKIYLAVCLTYPPLGRIEEARDYYRELIGSKTRDKWADPVRNALALSYRGVDIRKAAELFRMFAKEATKPEAVALFKGGLRIIAHELQEAGGITTAELLIDADEDIFKEVEDKLDLARKGKGVFNFTFAAVMHACRFDNKATADHVNELFPKLKERFPEMKAYLLLKAAACQIDTNSPVVQEFSESLEWSAAHPDQVLSPKDYFEQLMWDPYRWAYGVRRYDLVARMGEVHRIAIDKKLAKDLSDTDKAQFGHAYMLLGKWKEALEIFEGLANRAVDLSDLNTEAWPNQRPPSSSAQIADLCRQRLGISSSGNAVRSDLGRPFARLKVPFAFCPDSKGVWLAALDRLILVDLQGKQLFETRLDKRIDTRVTCLLDTPNTMWIGTDGDGLLEYDKSKNVCRKFTEKDGLLINSIGCLYLRDRTLFIGYGQHTTMAGSRSPGGLGRLDLATHRFSSFTTQLTGDAEELTRSSYTPNDTLDSLTKPPRRYVAAIQNGRLDELALLVLEKDIQAYMPRIDRFGNYGIDAVGGRQSCIVGDAEHLFVGHFESQGEHNYFQKVSGGLSVYTFATYKWDGFRVPEGLPGNNVSALALDGQELWVGGKGYVAAVNPFKKTVRKTLFHTAEWVKRLVVAEDALWIQIEQVVDSNQLELYRIPLASLR